MDKHIIIIIALMTISLGCSDNVILEVDSELMKSIRKASPNGQTDYFIIASSDDYASIPNQDPHNPITKEKVELGKMLFFETGLAQQAMHESCLETYSCSSCHIPSAGFLPGRKQGIADGAFGYGVNGSDRTMIDEYLENELDAQGIRPLSTLNVAYVTNTLWSGAFGANDRNVGTESRWTDLAEVNKTGYVGLEAQNIEGFHLHRLEINDHILDDYGYRALFDKAFSDLPVEERYGPESASFAMSAYTRTVLTNKTPFREYLKGNPAALTMSQKEGALLFFGKARCYTCHNSPSFSSMNFYALGTPDLYKINGLNTSEDDPRNLGRGFFTGEEKDFYRFKVPQLYNLKDYTHFFHGSSKSTLYDVVKFKIKAETENPKVDQALLSAKFRPVDLSEAEIYSLIDFLKNALYDEDVERYAPNAVLSGNCFPNNDKQSRSDLGCN